MRHGFQLLVVDDNEIMAGTLKDIFLDEGYETETAFSGPKALDMIQEGHYTCVISDIKMPDMNGFELCKSIKSIHPEIHVVLMTAYSTDNLDRYVEAPGALATLMKPIDIKSALDFFSVLVKKRSIILYTDDMEFYKATGATLELKNFAVTLISDPDQMMPGLEADVDVLLLDLESDRPSDLEMLKTISKSHPFLPVIIIGGNREGIAALVQEAASVNAHTCLGKPLQTDQLFNILDEYQRLELGRILRQSSEKGS